MAGGVVGPFHMRSVPSSPTEHHLVVKERNALDVATVACDVGADFLTALDIPHPDDVIDTAGGDLITVGAERDRPHTAVVRKAYGCTVFDTP